MKKIVFALLLCLLAMPMVAWTQTDQDSLQQQLYRLVQAEGVEAAMQRYRELNTRDSGGDDIGEGILNALGYRLLDNGQYESAVAVLELNTRQYPESLNVWDSLGEVLLASGNNEGALEQYRKVLSMVEADSTLPPPTRNFYRTNAEFNVFRAQHFAGRAVSDLHVASFFGGVPAGRWDMDNLAAFQERSGRSLSLSWNNLYFSPVPAVDPYFAGSDKADLTTSFMGGDYLRYVEEGQIADISDLWEEHGWEDVFPAPFREMASHEGRRYFLPMAYQWNPVWYRKDIFEEHGLEPPATWEELLELCDRLSELGYTPFTAGVQNWPPPIARWFTTLNLRLNGPDYHGRLMRGEMAWTDSGVREVFEHWRTLFRRGAFGDSSHTNTYGFAVQELTSGRAVMYNLGEWIFESLDEEQGAKLDFFVFPEMRADLPRAEIVHAYGAFISADAANRETAEELLAWLGSEESQRSNVESNGRIVAHTGVAPSLYSDVQRRIVEAVSDAEVLVPLFEMNTRPAFARRALAIFQQFWANPEDVEEAMQSLEEARREVFGTL